MSLVSVIVPVYKVEQYLEKCVMSICNQSYKEIEIILVDDGSPDQCGAMCDKFGESDERIKVIHKKNGGLGDARNAGVKAAAGKYLLFVDSDDYIHEELVEKTVGAAENADADIVLFDYATVEPGSDRSDLFTINMTADKVMSPKENPQLIKSSCSAINKLYKKSFWDCAEMQFPTGRYYEDLGTIPKLLAVAERIIYKKEVLYYYLMRDGSIMHSFDFRRNYEDRTSMLDGVLTFFKEQGIYEFYKQELEYLVFENGYFIPSREIVLNGCDREYLDKFRKYAYSRFPELTNNQYVESLSGKERILWKFLKCRMYWAMISLSYARRLKDAVRTGLGGN